MTKGTTAVLLLGLTGVLAACGGGSSTGAKVSSPGASTGKSTTTMPAAATVMVADSPLGKILVAANGRTLYELDKDTATTVSCTGGCTSLWPPLTATGVPVGGAGVTAAMLTTLTGPNGMQVVYAGHPLYTFAQDMTSGDLKGQGFAGNIWHVVSPTGQVITAALPSAAPSTTPPTTPPTSPPSGGGMGHGGYGY